MARTSAMGTAQDGRHGNKAQAIRDFLAQNPKARAKAVVAGLAAQGVSVSANHVYLVKSKTRGRKRRARNEAVATVVRTNTISNPADAVMRVKRLAQDVGGIRHLKALVDAISS